MHFVASNQISTYRKLNFPLISIIYFVFFSPRNAKKNWTDQSIPYVFLLCLKRNNPQLFKNASCKTLFSSVYVIATTCFDECFSFMWYLKDIAFHKSLSLPGDCFKRHGAAFLDASVARSPYFMRYLRNNNILPMPKFQK